MLTQDEQAVADVLEIQDLLDVLGELYAQRAAVVGPLPAQIAELQAQVTALTAAVDARIDAVQKAVKQAVATHGATVESSRVRATYIKPRITWDGKRLEGYAAAHPEIKVFRKEGKPSVRLVVLAE